MKIILMDKIIHKKGEDDIIMVEDLKNILRQIFKEIDYHKSKTIKLSDDELISRGTVIKILNENFKGLI